MQRGMKINWIIVHYSTEQKYETSNWVTDSRIHENYGTTKIKIKKFTTNLFRNFLIKGFDFLLIHSVDHYWAILTIIGRQIVNFLRQLVKSFTFLKINIKQNKKVIYKFAFYLEIKTALSLINTRLDNTYNV